MIELYKDKFTHSNIKEVLKGRASYLWGKSGKRRGSNFDSTDIRELQNARWLVNKDGELVSAKNTIVEDLHPSYRLDNYDTKIFLDFLEVEKDSLSGLPPVLRKELELVRKLKTEFTESELLEILANKKRENLQQKQSEGENIDEQVYEKHTDDVEELSTDDSSEDVAGSFMSEELDDDFTALAREISVKASKKMREKREQEGIDKGGIIYFEDAYKLDGNSKNEETSSDDYDIELPDEDDYIKAPVNYEKKIEREKEKASEQVEQIRRMQELNQEAEKAKKYSYGWFKSLLAMEANISDSSDNSHEVCIKFARVRKEPETEKTLVLSNPNQYIPMFMEEISNVKLEFTMDRDTPRKATIDAMSVKGYTLKVKLRSAEEIEGIDFDSVRECKISAQSPMFLLNELINRFMELDFADDYDMKSEFTPNMKFVFGPPGTGKTTYLAREVITPFMAERNAVLVLTPTNKAADVLARRVFDLAEDKEDCRNWLIRFGTTNDEFMEREGIYKDKTIKIKEQDRYTVVTTVARFAYDYFITGKGLGPYLRDMPWDYIVFDEASMIHLPSIVYPLYKSEPKCFIIAGDPLQIEPIAKVDLWKDENIYKMTKLSSFSNPHTEPHPYDVIQLTKQFRSIPLVGDIYSKFAYDGLLEHNRQAEDVRKLNIEAILPLKNLNIIKFPVSPYEGVYRAKRLQAKSPYHIYAALFAVEFTRYIAQLLAENNGDEPFSIGVIAPYKTEANLIDKLLVQQNWPKSISIQAGTIHGFQGDECDIILCVLNPPPRISSSGQMFLNKRNILNVAVSRAKDYLFVVMPDDDTPGINNLSFVNYLTKLMKHNGCAEFSARSLEEIMFHNPTYIEDNTFTTSHQEVNVYGLPEKYYEVRSEDTALDVQIHKDSSPQNTDVKETSENKVEAASNLYVSKIDLYDVLDSDGWNIWELSMAMDVYDRFKRNGESIELMVDELTELLISKGRSEEQDDIKMELVYKIGVFSRLDQGLGSDEAGASELEYEIWRIYKGNPVMYDTLKKDGYKHFRA